MTPLADSILQHAAQMGFKGQIDLARLNLKPGKRIEAASAEENDKLARLAQEVFNRPFAVAAPAHSAEGSAPAPMDAELARMVEQVRDHAMRMGPQGRVELSRLGLKLGKRLDMVTRADIPALKKHALEILGLHFVELPAAAGVIRRPFKSVEEAVDILQQHAVEMGPQGKLALARLSLKLGKRLDMVNASDLAALRPLAKEIMNISLLDERTFSAAVATDHSPGADSLADADEKHSALPAATHLPETARQNNAGSKLSWWGKIMRVFGQRRE